MGRTAPSKSVATYEQRMIIGRTERRVLDELRRRQLAGELHSAGPEIRPITRGAHAGEYGIPVYLRVTPPRRRSMLRPVLGVAAGIGTLLGLGWWVLSTLSGTALAVLLVAVLALFLKRVHRTITVTTTTTTRVTVR